MIITFSEIRVLQAAIRPLDCGVHYCRYCPAGTSNHWNHTPNCAYKISLKTVEEAREIVNRLETENAEV